ncbi:MAG TPA: polysaccharide ABC transporter ATP-binding protein [Stellaceae bacterium]|jgi:lipopolysaccharide transport system ATP-binding protein|nr:polysaccharide ABC transporter ATP-binding protein [Stellaceae bacterium]
MSDDVVIRVEGLGKKYAIGHQAERERYTALRDVMARGAKGLWRKAADMARGRAIVAGDTVEEFWALKDVSFEVKRGEVLGIIGRNGAGKSTLLKILSRITEPSEGRVTIKGRVASLLEVGTGFHPELTGRENIYLNGAILGMTRAEIRKKFDEIVAFAEVDKFLDTPVKRYSSGMYVRLAFAVAAHLEPDILVVDEVLAVGDAEFQKKCLGKMSEVAGGGRTVLFVSHNIASLQRICANGLLLTSGQLAFEGTMEETVSRYSESGTAYRKENQIYFDFFPTDKPYLKKVDILDKCERPLLHPRTWGYVKFRITFYSPTAIKSGSVVLYISTKEGVLLTLCSTSPDSAVSIQFKPGENVVDCDFPNIPLSAGAFIIGAGLAIPNVEWLDNQMHAATIQIEARDLFNSGLAPVVSRYPVPMAHIWRVFQTEETLVVGSKQGQFDEDKCFPFHDEIVSP